MISFVWEKFVQNTVSDCLTEYMISTELSTKIQWLLYCWYCGFL